MAHVFQEVFGNTSLGTKGAICDGDGESEVKQPGGTGDSDVLDELSLNESQHYKMKVSKYLTTTLRCINDNFFWFYMYCTNTLRNPLLHFYAHLSTPTSRSDFLVVNTITYKLTELADEFNTLFNRFIEEINDAMKFAATIGGAGAGEAWQDWISGSLAILLHNAGAFNRRVVTYFNRLYFTKHVTSRIHIFDFRHVSNITYTHAHTFTRIKSVIYIIYVDLDSALFGMIIVSYQ